MRNTARIFSLLLCLSLLCGTLLACGGNGDGGDTTAPATTSATTGTGTGVVDKWKDVNFSGTTLKIMYNDVVTSFVLDTGATNSYDYLRGPDDEGKLSSGVMKEAAARANRVKEKLELDVEYSFAGGEVVDDILPMIEALVSTADESTPDIVIHQNYGMVRAGIMGHLYNALDATEPGNYFDLTDEGWYLDMMLENTLDTSKIYMLMGDFFIDNFRMAYALLGNLQMIDDTLSEEGGVDSLYDTVREGNWTYDEMMRIAAAGAIDGGTPGAFDEGDIMGVIGDQGWLVRSFFATSGLDIFERDENGIPSYVEDIGAVHDWVDELLGMDKEAYFEDNWTIPLFGASVTTTFINGGTMFATNQMVLSMEGSRVLDMDGNAPGMFPNPKYVPTGTEASTLPYGALISDNANSGGVLLSSPKFSAASAFLQLMTEESDEFINQYYEVTLKYKNNPSAAAGHVDMMTYIHDGICCPMSFFYDNYCAKSLSLNTYSMIIYASLNGGSNVFSSEWAGSYTAKQQQLENIIATYGESSGN